MAGKHVPERTCIACGEKRPQKQFLRIASQDGTMPVSDETGRAPGRGAYLCRRTECVELALKKRSLERSLRLVRPLTDEWKMTLRAVLKDAADAQATPVGDDSMQ